METAEEFMDSLEPFCLEARDGSAETCEPRALRLAVMAYRGECDRLTALLVSAAGKEPKP